MVLPTFLSLFIKWESRSWGSCRQRQREVCFQNWARGVTWTSPTVKANSGDDVGARRVGAFWVPGVGVC